MIVYRNENCSIVLIIQNAIRQNCSILPIMIGDNGQNWVLRQVGVRKYLYWA